MEKAKASGGLFSLVISYVWLAALWSGYRLWGQNLLYGALPELPAAFFEGAVKLLIYGLPVLVLIKTKKADLVSPANRWLRVNRETFTVGLGGGALFLTFFLLVNLMKNGMQGLVFQSPGAGEILSTVLFAGLTEELFFRGLLLNSLMTRLSFVKADVITALAFALIHLPSWLSSGGVHPAVLLTNLVSVFVVGLLLGGVFEKSRNLWGPFFFHALYNFGVIFLTV